MVEEPEYQTALAAKLLLMLPMQRAVVSTLRSLKIGLAG